MIHKKLLILGFGGHARAVGSLALSCGYEELIFIDEHAKPDENFLGYPVLKEAVNFDSSWVAFAASGDGKLRQKQCDSLETMSIPLVSLISPTASIGAGAVVESGTFIGPQSHIGPLARIGRSCIINTGAVVEHESSVGDYSHVSINASVAGRSGLGSFSMLGAGATVIDGVFVGDRITIGAGAVVIASISQPGVYVGVPVRKI